jgi:DNA-binding NtrC family response regulator
LRNVIERAVILETSSEIAAASLPDFSVEARLRKGGDKEGRTGIQPGQSFEDAVNEFESRIISEALGQNQNNMNKTAEQLQLTRHALRYRMQRLDLLTGGSDGGD